MNASSMRLPAPGARPRGTWAAGLLLGMLGGAAHAADCQLACLSTEKCDVRCAQSSCVLNLQGKEIELDASSLKSVRGCEHLELGATGRLELRYRHKGRWFWPPGGVRNGQKLGSILEQYPPDACGVPSPECLQNRMAGMVASVGGHGIDDKLSQPAGQGDPCRLGLPCGAVVPPGASWRVRLVDPALSGTWTVRLARGTPPAGQPAEVAVRIDRGQGTAAGAWFVPGAQYAYRFADAAGRHDATGEFSVISQTTAQALRTLTQRRMAQGLSEGVAWSDTLAANNLEWDAYQLSLDPKGAR